MPPFDLSVKAAAEKYFALGFRCFPVNGVREDGQCTCGKLDCGQAGKHPATRNGLKDAVSTWEEYEKLVAGRTMLNIAIATGPESGFWVLDVDGPEGAQSLGALDEDGQIAATDTASQSTGKGHHIIYRHPGRKVFSRVKKLGDGLDTRGDGGYIVAAPSRHRSGAVYTWRDAAIADAPEWLLDLVCSDALPAEQEMADNSHFGLFDDKPEWSDSDVRGMLTHLDPDMSYDDWIAVGMALHHGGFGMNIWESWSQGGRKFQRGACRTHWRSFKDSGNVVTMGTLVDMAQVNGWVPDAQVVEHVPIEGHPAEALLRRISGTMEAPAIGEPGVSFVPTIPDPAQVQFKPLAQITLPVGRKSGSAMLIDGERLPGILGETCAWINRCAIHPQPVLAMLNVLAAAGCLFGRRYQGHTGIRTNLYMVGVAPTGAGKEHSRSCMKALLGLAGQNELLGGDKIISAAGVATMLSKFPRRLVQLDEIGLFLQAIGHKNAGSYERMISMVLTELFSSSKTVWNGGHYADAKKEVVTIAAPHLCIYGTTTLSSYAGALKREVIASGELNRYLVLPGNPDPDLVLKPGVGTPPTALVDKWRELAAAVSRVGGNLADQPEMLPVPVTVTVGPAEEAQFNAMRVEQKKLAAELGEDVGPLWMRYAENAMKVALVCAIARSPSSPVLGEEDLRIGQALARNAVDYALGLAREHMVSGDFEKNCQRVLQKVRAAGSEGLARQALSKASWNWNLDKRGLDNVLGTLLDGGSIAVKSSGDGAAVRHRQAVVYVALE